jgi:hypothetical protein
VSRVIARVRDGKEGVDGSSPSEGFAKVAAYRPISVCYSDDESDARRPPNVHRALQRPVDGALNEFLTALWLPLAASTERPRGGRGFLYGE